MLLIAGLTVTTLGLLLALIVLSLYAADALEHRRYAKAIHMTPLERTIMNIIEHEQPR